MLLWGAVLILVSVTICTFALYTLNADILVRDLLSQLLTLLTEKLDHPLLLVISFLILPVLGFPVTPLIILLGVQFDSFTGVLIMLMIMPVHLTVSFWITKRFLNTRADAFCRKTGYQIFQVPENQYMQFAFLFMAIPGVPYAIKNLMIPLFGLPFLYCVGIGWMVQGTVAIPFVVLGNTASQLGIYLFPGAIVLVGVSWLFSKKIKKGYDDIVKASIKKE